MLDRGGLAVSSFNVRCMRSCLPFCCGFPGSMRSGMMPSFTHFTDSFDKPPGLRAAKGAPLSVRIRQGSPYSWNAASKTGATFSSRSVSTRSRRSSIRLKLSVIVSGLQTRPATRKHPLKSADHTTLGAVAEASGCVLHGTRGRRRTGSIKPRALSKSPIVLGAGHVVSGYLDSNHARSLRGPQKRCLCRKRTIASATGSGVVWGRPRGARDRSTRLAMPPCRNRSIHL
jgi:hypothetical protein